MTLPIRLLEWLIRLIIDLVRAAARRRLLLSGIGLAIVLVAAGADVAIAGLGINPTHQMISVRLLLPESGGLLPNQDVTLRGIPVGRIQSVNFTANGVEVIANVKADVHIPQNSPVRVSGMSMAGEQYLDFRPERGSHGIPNVSDGTVISGGQVTTPVSLTRIIDDSHGALAQLDAEKLTTLLDELRVSRDAPQKLAAILDGSIFLAATLDGVLPQTVGLLRNTRVMLSTVDEVNPGLRRTMANLQKVAGGMTKMDSGYRTLVDNGSAQLAAFDNFIGDSRENIVQLLGNLATVSQLMYLRIPALRDLWRSDHESLIDRVGSIVHDGAMWTIVDIYPKYRCDYNLPRHSYVQGDFPEPYLYTYCDNPDPAVLVRGARNAPRPAGEEEAAGPPPGVDGRRQADATPVYPPYTLPTTLGGPPLPAWVPD